MVYTFILLYYVGLSKDIVATFDEITIREQMEKKLRPFYTVKETEVLVCY